LQNDLAIVGWLNTRMYLATGDQAKSQGWTALVVDKPVDPAKDTRIPFGMYAIAWSPADGSIGGSNLTHPGYVIRLIPGPNPPDTALAELYKMKRPDPRWLSRLSIS
jgi:hypothetical protein